ncbi:Amine oxidase [Mycena kentingensis (nom. inval.)]|nr:Amine oxidase [Mycena kentingensis (nom. inval.)]
MAHHLSLAPSPNIRSLAGKHVLDNYISGHAPIFDLPLPVRAHSEPYTANLNGTIGILGAGVSGLYTAMLLDSLNVSYEIIEANPTRVGGRLFTYRFNGEAGRKAPVNDPARYDHIDIGAMRFPRIDFMARLFDLFKRLDMNKDGLLVEYKFSANNTFELFNGIRRNTADLTPRDTDPFKISQNRGGAVPDAWVAQGIDSITSGIYSPYTDAFRKDFATGWTLVSAQDHFSVRGYLLSQGLPESVVEWLETFQTGTGMYDQAFVESVFDAIDFASPAPVQIPGTAKDDPENYAWVCVDGGSDRISERMVGRIAKKPKLGRRVTKIESAKNGMEVISTLPLGALSAIDFPNPSDLAYNMRVAIRALNYESSTKVALRFERRWWEDPDIMGHGRTIHGGISSTDLPIRTCVYPSYGFNATGALPGVLLASYTWAQDARRLGGLAPQKGSAAYEQLIDLVLDNLASLHGIPRGEMGKLVDSYVLDWHADPLARGTFGLFGPGQFGGSGNQGGHSLFASIKAPAARGRLHFAGEATSVHHGWVLASLNSAWRAVYQAVGGMPDGQRKRAVLVQEWGVPDEEEEDQLVKLAVLAKALA